MGIVDKIKTKKEELEDKYLDKEEKALLMRLDRARAVHEKKERINALKQELSSFEPKTSPKQPQNESYMMGFMKNAGQVSLIGKPKGKKKSNSLFQDFELGWQR